MKTNRLLTLLLTAVMAVSTWSTVWADTYVSEAYSAESATDGWKSSVDGRFTPVILEEDGNYFLTVDPTSRYNNGAVVTGTVLADKIAAGKDFTLTFDLRIGNSNDQTPVTFEVKDAANAANLFVLAATATNVDTWTVNGNQTVTLPGSGYNKAQDESAIKAINWVTVSISRKGDMTFATLTNKASGEEIFPQTLVDASAAGGVGNIVFTSRRYFANFAIDNITLRDWQTGDTPDASTTTYTVRFLDEAGNAIKDDVIVSAPVGSEATASPAQTADFLLDDDKWIYTGGNTTITLVEDATQNVITLNFRKAAIYSYSIVATDQAGNVLRTLHQETGFELDNVIAPYPIFISNHGILYKKEPTDKSYYTTFTLDGDGMTVNHQYVMTGISSVVYCTEGEDIEGVTVINTGNSQARSSNAASGYATEADLPIVTLPAGQYTLHAVGYLPNSAEGTVAITNGTDVLFTISGSRSNWTEGEIMLTLEAETTLYLEKGNANGALDFLYIVEGDAVERFFQAEVNGRMMNFRVMNKTEKTVETYPCEDFTSGKAIEFFESETQWVHTDNTDIVIPATVVCPDDGETYSVVGIGDESFSGIWWFNSTVTIEEGVTYIGKSGFFNNRYEKIALPSTISSIADDAFGKSWNLEVMKVGMKTPVSKAVVSYDNKGNKELATLLVPEGTREAYAAAEYWNLFGNIEEYRPAGTVFTAQTEQGIDMQFRVLDDTEMTVETYAVPYAEGETFVPAIDINTSGELIIPAEIEGYRVVGIGGWSFRECQQITSVQLPVGITYIDNSAFRMATGLRVLIIPEGVETLGDHAFNGCPLTAVTLPSTLKKMTGPDVFRYSYASDEEGECYFIANMVYPCAMHELAIRRKAGYTLYVPKGSKEDYMNHPLWGQFEKIREIGEVDEDVKDIVSANSVTLKAGETTTLTVSLTTKDTDYIAYQFSLYLPEGISIATNEKGRKLVKEMTERTNFAKDKGDGSILFGAYANETDAAALTTGPLMEIQLIADAALAAGDYTVRIEQVICATRLNQSVALPSATFNVTVEKGAEPEVPSVVEADDVEADPAGQVTMPIFLNNQTDINSFYFDLTLPKGITVAEDAVGNILASLVDEYAEGKMLLMCQPWSIGMGDNTNTWRFVATPLGEDNVFKANAGHVMNITLNVDPNMASGVYTARLNMVKLVEASDEADGSRAFRVMHAPTAYSNTSFAKITIKGSVPGDVNGDFVVDVADIASVISVMAAGTNASQADVNHDGVVDVADIASIISTMAANSRQQRRK